MSLTKTFIGLTSDTAADHTDSASFNSTGYTHVVCAVKHEGPLRTITMSDNKGTTGWNPLTNISHSNNDLHAQFFWAKIGTPGTGHVVTSTFDVAPGVSGRRLLVWLVNASGGELSAADHAEAFGTSAAADAGTLTTTAPTVSFMMVGEYDAVTYTPSAGWNEDVDNFTFGASRSDATGTLDPAATISASMAWVSAALSLREPGAADPNSYTTYSKVVWSTRP